VKKTRQNQNLEPGSDLIRTEKAPAALRIEGYVIVSADGMLADSRNVMPDALKFEGDKAFFTAALDRADLIVHGRNSFEDQPNSPRRKRIILTHTVAAIAPDPANPKSTLWNPDGAPFEAALKAAGVDAGTVAVIGGPGVFDMFMDRYDVFWLSVAPHVRLPGGEPCFPGVPTRSPQDILTAHGLRAGEPQMLDPAHQVTVTPWRRDA
jgi:dihydrofolate reductase